MKRPGTSKNQSARRYGAAGAVAFLVLGLWSGQSDATPAPQATGEPVRASAVDPLFDDPDEAKEPAGLWDPLERFNRGTLRFNQIADRWLLNPITRAYGFVLPGPVKQAVRRVLANLNSPPVLVNDVLQREWRDAGTCLARFAINSSIGVGGIFDPATGFGLEAHTSDFGQTLALGGVGNGPYLMIPLLGPVTARDGIGYLVDAVIRPTTFIFGPGGQLIIFSGIQGGMLGLATREARIEAVQALEESSIDYYTALREAYYQNRTAQIWDRREHHRQGHEIALGKRLSRRWAAAGGRCGDFGDRRALRGDPCGSGRTYWTSGRD